jgi:hypothetical protein
LPDLREIVIDGLPPTPAPGTYWELRADSRANTLSSYGKLRTVNSLTGDYTLHLVDTNGDKEYTRLVGTILSDDTIVFAAERLLNEYMSRNRAKALEEGPLRLVPARKNQVYNMPC